MTDAPLHQESLLLSPYLDHVLEPGEADRLEAHLAGCDACRRQLEGLRQTVALVKALPHERMPHPVSIPVRRPQAWGRNAFLPLAGAAAAVLLALAGGFQLGRSGIPNPATESGKLYSLSREAAGGPKGASGPALADIRQSSAADDAARVSGFAPRGVVTLSIATDRTTYSRSDTVVITTNTSGAPNRAALQFDRNGYRVPIPAGRSSGSETRTALELSSLSPALTPGDYRIVATLPLEGSDAQLAVEVRITVK